MAYREVTDAAGVLWRMWDTIPKKGSAVRPHYAAGWLGFESDTGRRRLAPIPAQWEQGSDDALIALLAQAEPIDSTVVSAFTRTQDATAVPAETGTLLSYIKSVISEVDKTIRGS
jgi:hypothetical protein